MVTARKWRPQVFSDVVGQDNITTTLKNAVASHRLHHAYLFCGPRGVGKTTCARILARSVNCLSSVDGEPCNECSHCTSINASTSVDVIEIDGASNNSVDDIRTLRENARYSPMQGVKRVYIIDEVHMLSTAAFNALLKILEEPPPHLIFIFATTEIQKVPATILSRCQRFDFRRMELNVIKESLRNVANTDGIEIDEEALHTIAIKADGSMRDSQSIFDQVVAFCGTRISYSDIAQALHVIDVDFYFSLSKAIAHHDIAQAFELANTVVERGYDLQECLLGLLEHYRNILTVVATGSDSLIASSSDVKVKYREAAAEHSQAEILRIMTLISQGEAVLRQHPPQPRVRFEFTLVRLAGLDSTIDIRDYLSSEPKVQPGKPVPKKTAPSPLSASASAKKLFTSIQSPAPEPALVSALTAESISVRWLDYLASLEGGLKFLRQMIERDMVSVNFTDVSITFTTPSEVVANNLHSKHRLIHDSIGRFFGAPLAVIILSEDAPETVNDNNADSSRLSPVEKALMEIFQARKIHLHDRAA